MISGSWPVDAFLAPFVTGVAVGLALRAAAAFQQIADHDLRAEALGIDLRRWIWDRDHQLEVELRKIGISTPLYSGSRRNSVFAAMRKVLHEYRDEASSAVRSYVLMARSEGIFHRIVRRWRKTIPPSLHLSDYEQIMMLGWRERSVPGEPEAAPVKVDMDPTRMETAREIFVLEQPDGLTWREAAQVRRRS
jgi:hypothetical protein